MFRDWTEVGNDVMAQLRFLYNDVTTAFFKHKGTLNVSREMLTMIVITGKMSSTYALHGNLKVKDQEQMISMKV